MQTVTALIPSRAEILKTFGVTAHAARALAERFSLRGLITRDNPKIIKGAGQNVLSGILHLAPFNLSGWNVCPWADGCEIGCLNTAGRGGIIKKGETTNPIQEARIRRTKAFFADRKAFMALLALEIRNLAILAEKNGMAAAMRLNGTSDLRFHLLAPDLFSLFPTVAFYDYTKDADKARAFAADELPSNYHVTFSRSAKNETTALQILASGVNVAAVFSTKVGQELPTTWKGFTVIDGDLSDLRYRDGKDENRRAVVVGLRAKGKAKKDSTGFVVYV